MVVNNNFICPNMSLIAQYFCSDLCKLICLLLSILSVIVLFQIFNTFHLAYHSKFPTCLPTFTPFFPLSSIRIFSLNPTSHHVTWVEVLLRLLNIFTGLVTTISISLIPTFKILHYYRWAIFLEIYITIHVSSSVRVTP